MAPLDETHVVDIVALRSFMLLGIMPVLPKRHHAALARVPGDCKVESLSPFMVALLSKTSRTLSFPVWVNGLWRRRQQTLNCQLTVPHVVGEAHDDGVGRSQSVPNHPQGKLPSASIATNCVHQRPQPRPAMRWVCP